MELCSHEGTRKIKEDLNRTFIDETISSLKDDATFQASPFHCMYLDGPHARTTRLLLQAGLNKNKILPVSNEQKAYKTLLRLAPYAVYGWLHTALDEEKGIDLSNHTLASCWLDFCQTWHGRTEHEGSNPIDVFRLLIRSFVKEGSYVAITCNLHDRRTPSWAALRKRILCDIRRILKQYHFTYNRFSTHSRIEEYSTMIFIGFRLESTDVMKQASIPIVIPSSSCSFSFASSSSSSFSSSSSLQSLSSSSSSSSLQSLSSSSSSSDSEREIPPCPLLPIAFPIHHLKNKKKQEEWKAPSTHSMPLRSLRLLSHPYLRNTRKRESKPNKDPRFEYE